MTTLSVNSPKGKSLTNPRINTYSVFKKWNFTNLYVCSIYYFSKRPPNLFEENVKTCHGLSR